MKLKEKVSNLLDVLPSTSNEFSKSKDGKGVKNAVKIADSEGAVGVNNDNNVANGGPEPLNVHVPVTSVLSDISNMRGLVNIHFHFGSK